MMSYPPKFKWGIYENLSPRGHKHICWCEILEYAESCKNDFHVQAVFTERNSANGWCKILREEYECYGIKRDLYVERIM